MEPVGSSPHSQASATCPYPVPAQSSPHTHIPPPGDPSLGTHNENNKPFKTLLSSGTWGLRVHCASTNKPVRGTTAFIFRVEGVGSRSLRYVGTKSSFYRRTEHCSAAALSIARQQRYHPLTGAQSGDKGKLFEYTRQHGVTFKKTPPWERQITRKFVTRSVRMKSHKQKLQILYEK